jgi:hypothetical protein
LELVIKIIFKSYVIQELNNSWGRQITGGKSIKCKFKFLLA